MDLRLIRSEKDVKYEERDGGVRYVRVWRRETKYHSEDGPYGKGGIHGYTELTLPFVTCLPSTTVPC